MNNSELNEVLKKAGVPERPQEYWNQFPSRITARLQWSQKRTSSPSIRRWSLARIALGTAAVCLLFALGLGVWKGRESRANESLVQMRKYYNEIESLFPNQVKGIVFDNQGPRLLLAEASNLPESAALYIKICSKQGCRQFVTFSGQRIRFGTDTFDVLVNRQGEVLLTGDKMVWSADSSAGQAADYRIEARQLGGAS
jgi:hypothetical protein